MLRPYIRGFAHFLALILNLFGHWRFFAALRADVLVFAQRNFQRCEQLLFVEAEALAVGDIAHVGAKFAVGPKKIADGAEQILDFVVPFDQFGDIAGGARRANIFQRLRGLRIEAHARHVLRKDRDERQARSPDKNS